MLKKTITYKDYNGMEITEDFYFNLNEAEVAEMQLTVEGGLAEYLTKISNTKNTVLLVKFFKEFLLKSYGEKSTDGKRFIKSPELSLAFEQTEAYSKLFIELLSNADEAGEFVKAVLPTSISSQTATDAHKPA